MRHSLKTGKYLLIFLAVLSVTSCSYRHKNILFKTRKEIKTKQPVLVVNPEQQDSGTTYRHRIKVGDRLLIRFLNNYDLGQGASQSATSAANNVMISGEDKGYLVNYDSTTTLPLIGRVNLIGYTRLEAAKKLEQLYSAYIINPIIDVNIASLSVTVLGEVNIPGKIRVDKESTTLIDVIALAGGLKDGGKKRNVRIIRGNEIIVVNLQKIEVIKDPNIIIHDNDLIYVEPYGIKAASEPLTTISPVSSLVLSLTQLVLLSFQLYTFTRSLR